MHSFRLRLFIGLLVVAVLAIVLVTLLTSRGISNRFITYVAGNEDTERQAIATVIEHQLQREGPESIGPLAGVIGEVYERPITLTDTEGDVLFSTEVIVEEEIVTAGSLLGHPPADSADLTLALSEDSGRVRIITTTEHLIGQPWGSLPHIEQGIFAAEEAAFLGDTNQLLIVTAVVALLLAGIAALWLSRSFVRPVFALTEAAERLAEGDLSQRVVVERPDELGRLALSFNAMAKNLEEQERLRRTMVSDVAHELRTPLANVRGYLEAIQDGVVLPDEATVSSLFEETLLLNQLVEDLQTLSLAEAGRLRYDVRPLEIKELLESGVRAVRPLAAEKEISLTLKTVGSLPLVLADAGRTGQVLRNLLSNAIAYTPAGGEIVVTAEPIDGDVAISVRDSGPGVSADHAAYLFERFYRADSSRERDTGGSGLGLAISKAYVEGQNGRIWLDNQGAGGAIFIFALPCVRDGIDAASG